MKTLTKHLSCECKCRFDGKNEIQINGEITINVDVSVEKFMYVKKNEYVWNLSKCICESEKYLASIMDDSMITYDGVINLYDEKIKTIPTNFYEKKVTCKTQKIFVLLAFLLITIKLLITVSINCYMIKYQTKLLLTFHSIKN